MMATKATPATITKEFFISNTLEIQKSLLRGCPADRRIFLRALDAVHTKEPADPRRVELVDHYEAVEKEVLLESMY